MTIEEKLEQALATIEGLKTEKTKLLTKVEEVIGDTKRAKAEAEAAKEAADAAAEEKARASKDVEALEKSITAKFEKTIKELTALNETKDSTLKTLLIDNSIQAGLNEHGIAPAYHKAVTAMLKADAKLDGDVAKIGDVPLADYMKTFVGSEEGKSFVAAPANSGANAPGSTTTATGMTKENFSLTKIMEVAKTDPAQAKALATSAGYGDLFQ